MPHLHRRLLAPCLLFWIVSAGFWLPAAATPTVQAAPPITATPAYYYDHETAFILNFAVDPVYGGMYTAVDANGSSTDAAVSPIPESVWGSPPGTIFGADKSHIGQGVCIRYLIGEYQRVTVSGEGLGGINAVLAGMQPVGQPLTTPLDLLRVAQRCADFIPKMEITVADQLLKTDYPDRLFYWGYTNRQGNGNFLDDSASRTTGSAARSESAVSWSLAELALALKEAGRPQSEWQPYVDSALRWWNWRKTTAMALPPYGDSTKPRVGGPCSQANLNPNNCIAGIGRDVFYGPLGILLTLITGNPVYRDGDGTKMKDGKPYGALPYANSILKTGDTPELNGGAPYYIPIDPLQSDAYVTGHARAIMYALMLQRQIGTPQDRDQYWDFGTSPALTGNFPNYSVRPATDAEFTSRADVPFGHRSGREIYAGTQRSDWFYYTFGQDPRAPYMLEPGSTAPANLTQEKFGRVAIDLWYASIDQFWDATAGQQAWFEAKGKPYKPCFSGGTEVPLGAWLKPQIADKVHTLNADGSATVTVSGVRTQDFPYLSWKFRGGQIATVEVVYSFDQGATWTALTATSSDPTTFLATIPKPAVPGKVFYYARVKDTYGNWTAFPAGTENWNTLGQSQGIAVNTAQTYNVPAGGNAVTLTSFTATHQTSAVNIAWSTASEVDSLGFALYRSTDGQRATATKVTPTLIPAKGQPGQGANYTWRDDAAPSDERLSYWLVETERNGTTREYGPVRTQRAGPSAGLRIYLPMVK